MLIDCDTCTVRGEGCADCVVTVLLGAPPDWQGSDPSVVPFRSRGQAADARPVDATAHADHDSPESASPNGDVSHIDIRDSTGRPVVELDEVERRAVDTLAEFGLVPPLRHQDASLPERDRRGRRDRYVS